MPSPSSLNPRSWTLRSKLLASVLLLFALVMIATGTATVALTQRHLDNQLQADLTNTLRRMEGGPFTPPVGDEHDNEHAPPQDLGRGGGLDALTLAVNNGTVVSANGVAQNTYVDASGNRIDLTDAQVADLLGAKLGATPKRVSLPGGAGTFLTVAGTRADGTFVAFGLPTRNVDRTVTQLLWLVGLGSVLGLVLVGVGGDYLIRRNLEPLTRVAATARQVGGLRLDSGEVSLPARVEARDATPSTEVGQVGHALNTMLDNVEGALQTRQESEMRIRRFVADASHELRTPLAAIRGYAELSRRETEPVPAPVAHAIGRVESEALRMQGLVEDLLLLARLDAGRPLERDQVDLSQLAVNLVSDARAAAPGYHWRLDLPDEPVEVPGDEARLHQVFANLLANSRTHCPAGTTVTLAIRTAGEAVRMSVTDDGPGIPADLQPHVFERFTRADDARSREKGSTGLGLSIVQAVTRAHGGHVELASQPGRTTFTVVLPAH